MSVANEAQNAVDHDARVLIPQRRDATEHNAHDETSVLEPQSVTMIHPSNDTIIRTVLESAFVHVHAPSSHEPLTDRQRLTLIRTMMESASVPTGIERNGNANFVIAGDLNTRGRTSEVEPDSGTLPCRFQRYIDVADRRPVFLPPPGYFVPQPQEWAQCACHRQGLVCVYDGDTLCHGCTHEDPSRPCDCEPGCCGCTESDSSSDATWSQQCDGPAT
jgi:hypothetical protein